VLADGVDTEGFAAEWDALAYRERLVDEYRLVVHPVVLGAGTPFWPELDAPLRLRLVETQTFASGAELRSYVPS
jgi:dihydrofolate reductase